MIQLIHGDCYQEIKKIPDKSIDLVYIDIPYLFEQGGESGTYGTKNCPYNQQIRMQTADIAANKGFWEELCRTLKHIYIYIYGVQKSRFTH